MHLNLKFPLIVGLVLFVVVIFLLFSSYNHSPQSQVEEVAQFRPELLSWSQATSSAEWQPRDSAVSFVFKDKIWTMGGLNGNNMVDSNHIIHYWEAPHFNDIWVTEDGAHWDKIRAKAEWPLRRSMSVVFFQNKLWMFGGWSPVTGYTNDIWQSSDGITWTKISSSAPWPAREGQSVELFQGKIWLFAGVNYDKHEAMNDIWYSDDALSWHKATTTIPWSPRWDHATTIFNGKIFLAGGMNLHGQIFKDIWSSADGFNWTLVSGNPPWQERQGFSLVVFHDKMWTIGRLNDVGSGGLNDIWYSSDGTVWQKTQTNPPWFGREDHSALIFRNKIFVFGGMDSNWQWRNDVWTSD